MCWDCRSCAPALEIDGFWAAFEDIPLEVTVTHNLQMKLSYLGERLEASAEPLL